MNAFINKQRVLDTFCRLVEIDSPTYFEREMCDELTRRLTELGLRVVENGPCGTSHSNCGNLVAYLPSNTDKPLEPIMFSSHMDTVSPARGKRAVIHEDGVITSGGDTVLGADDVSGLTAILEALSVIREQQLPHGPFEFIFTTGEEVFADGGNNLDFSLISAKQGYVFDLSAPNGTAAYRAPTILTFSAEIHGKAAHAGFEPEKGVHAIKIAANAISKLKLGRIDPETTVNIGLIQGGSVKNAVPAACTVTGEVRSYNHEKALKVAEQMGNEFRACAEELGGSAEISIEIGVKAYLTPLDAPVCERFRKVCAKRNIPVSFLETFGGSDLNTQAQEGIQGLVLASAMENCHTCQEYSTVQGLWETAQMALDLMLADVE